MTTKQIEHATGCKIMIRGKGSMRDRKKVSRLHSAYAHAVYVLPEFRYTQCVISFYDI